MYTFFLIKKVITISVVYTRGLHPSQYMISKFKLRYTHSHNRKMYQFFDNIALLNL